MKNQQFIKSLFIIAVCFISNTVFSQTQLLSTSGKLSFLRVHEVGSKYGPPTDQIDAEGIIKFKRNSDKAFGFKLRNDNNKFVRSGMLDVLRDAFTNDHTVTINYKITPGKKNGVITRVWVTK